MTPFTIDIPDTAIADLKARLAAARFPDELEGAGWDYGTNIEWLKDFVAYWRDGYDWRAAEARLNGFAQFTTEIDGELVHFVHVRGQGDDPTPILLANGWPSNFVELLPLVPFLTAEADGRSYDVIIPSMPGYGFSGKPKRKGMHLTAVAHIWARLMQQLGYERYLVSGSDIGGGAVLGLVRHYPDRLIGAHYCNVYSQYPRPDEPTPEELEYFGRVDYSSFTEGAYAMVQGTKPSTLAVGLNDSPAGLGAWILEKYATWGDTGGDIDSAFSRDDLATILSIYWFTETIGSSVRMYKEAYGHPDLLSPMPAHDVPQGVLVPAACDLPAPRAWGERHLANLIHWSEVGGGHFPALEIPERYAGDIRAFHGEAERFRR